jgi:hypothetical protein
MIDQPSFEREINAYLVKVDGILEGRRLLSKKGSALLNLVQKEVDMTLNNLRSIQRTGLLDRVKIGTIASDSLKRVEIHADRIITGTKVPLSGIFGSLSTESIFTSPAWKDVFSRVSAEVSNFTNTYGVLISNMDSVSRAKIDKALATIIDNAQTSFNSNSTDAGASRYLKDSLQSLKALEGAAQSQQVMSVVSMLQVLVQEKDQERVKLLASMKLIEKKLSVQQITVVNDASRRAMEKLDAILKDQRSYDAAIRSRKLKLVDSDLDIMRRTIQNTSFADQLGNLPPPRSGGSKLGYLNKHQLISDFRDAPTSNLGGGLGMSFKTIKLVDPMASPHDILATVKHNSMILNAQGGLTPEQKPVFLRQVNSLTKESYGGNITSLQEAQKQYRALLSINLGSMTLPQIRDKHPAGTKESHIKRMHHHMEKGRKFAPAHNLSTKEGFTPGNLGGAFMYDQAETSMINGVRLLGSFVLYLVIPTAAIYVIANQMNATKKSNALKAMLGDGEE